MDHREIAGLMAAIAPTIGDFVAKAIAPLRAENARLSSSLAAVEQRCADMLVAREQDNVIFINLIRDEIEKSEPKFDMGALDRVVTEKVGVAFSALPVPKDGKDADPEEIAQMVEQAVAKVPPTPAKDVDPEVIKAAVLDIVADVLPAEVAAAVDKIEKPKDGKDGKDADPVEIANLLADLMPVPADGKSVTVDDVMPALETLVAALPPAVNGKDADPETIRSMVLAELAKIEPVNGKDGRDGIDGKDGAAGKDGQDGKSVELDDVIPVITAEVSKLVLPEGKQGPQGEPGKSVTLDEVTPLIAAEVSKLVLPEGKQGPQGEPGEPGASVSVPEVREIIQSLFDALPRAVNGKDADPAEVAALIVGDVAALMPVPADGKDGKSVTLEEIIPLVEDAAAKKLPASFLINEEGNLLSVFASGDTKAVGKVRGEPGAALLDGHVDDDGTLVLRISDGRAIRTGVVRGDPGKDGEHGQRGEHGRDAYEIQILPGIDEGKSYVEGVCAMWRGGLIRAARQTDPIKGGDIAAAGWKPLVRGIAEERETVDNDGRFIDRTTVYSDGTEFTRRIKTVTPIYRGVWTEGAYLKGDIVTWAGSSFIAQRDTTDKPEQTDAWKLSTKRGRDGKDGKIVDRSTPPVVKIDPNKK
ncbi:hypothetical protein [Bradyrhizobium sp. 150]|uniref:hypothetical protein n=1 Tax=Bradyrhizobium sp. 150 TaxID=2782625 RepID=UPI001FFBA22F|nr:hypothetical protein [Bradyrhizobium sp. 150]MCK1670288.1 hypothetical protein [Bradyrhizobium sp. 150]